MFPLEIDSFWGSSSNKQNLQLYIRKTIVSDPCKLSAKTIILSGEGTDAENRIPCTYGGGEGINDHDRDLEGADLRIIPHILYAIKKGSTQIVILWNDTDVLLLVLHYLEKYKKKGVKEIWQRGGTGNTIRYIPVHLIADILGKFMCKVLPAAHILTGCDATIQLYKS